MASCSYTALSSVGPLCTKIRPGGLNLWLVGYDAITGYTVSGTSSMITAIGLTGSIKYQSIGILKDSLGFDSEGTIDITKGVGFSTNTLTYKLGDLTVENQLHLDSLILRPVSAIIQLRTTKKYVMGLTGELFLSAFQATSGKATADEVTYTITLSETADIVPRMADPSITNIFA